MRLLDSVVNEAALTTESAVTLHFVFVNDGPEPVAVRLAGVSSGCCISAIETSPVKLAPEQARPYAVRVRVPATAGEVTGWCRFVASTLAERSRRAAVALLGRFEVAVVEPVELVALGAQGGSRMLASGLCGDVVALAGELRVRGVVTDDLPEEASAYDLRVAIPETKLKVTRFLGRRRIGSRIIEYRWEVHGEATLPPVPGPTEPMEVVVEANGRDLGRTWFVMRAKSWYRVDPRSVLIKCDGSGRVHRFAVEVRGDGIASEKPPGIRTTGSVRASVADAERGRCVVQGTFECGQESTGYAEIILRVDWSKQRCVRIPVLHLRVQGHARPGGEGGPSLVR